MPGSIDGAQPRTAGSTAAVFSMELFGVPGFRHMHYQSDGKWCVFSNSPYIEDNVDGYYIRLFHGTTLWQANQILKGGFTAGLFFKGSATSPCGIWGCTRRGDTLIRTKLCRGWSRTAGEVELSGWDCPVVLCILVKQEEVWTKKERLMCKNGTRIYCMKAMPGTVIDIAGRYCEIHILADLYERFRMVREKWQLLKTGEFVLCRTVRYNPESVFEDKSRPITCGRVVSTKSYDFSAWIRAKKSHEYRCPWCDDLYSQPMPASDND